MTTSTLPTGAKERKDIPLCSGVLDYFPAALAEVAKVSKAGNDQHNPGQPLHHARSKSTDHPDCIMRHLSERGTRDTDGQRHSAKMAWRALAICQEECEADGAPLARGAKLDPNHFTPGPAVEVVRKSPTKRVVFKSVDEHPDNAYVGSHHPWSARAGAVFTVGKEYEVIDQPGSTLYRVVDNNGITGEWFKDRFKEVPRGRVYVAGRFTQKEAVRNAQRLLREAGYLITHDWTTEDATGLAGEALSEYLTRCALNDVRGVKDADVVVLLHNDTCRGAFVEMGVALADEKAVLVVGGPDLAKDINVGAPIFYKVPLALHYETIEKAVADVAMAIAVTRKVSR